ncbi:hypothetical protein H4Q26_006236 [Puccinia striiformis f. sp. tritici PST-130]|nr:hypothetical protein H4Q26_006236 [Puccinia striiformis f. sp. tritici PST-130]
MGSFKQTSDGYEGRIRYLEDIVRLLLARTGASQSPLVMTSPQAGSFRYSVDRGLVPILSKATVRSLAVARSSHRTLSHYRTQTPNSYTYADALSRRAPSQLASCNISSSTDPKVVRSLSSSDLNPRDAYALSTINSAHTPANVIVIGPHKSQSTPPALPPTRSTALSPTQEHNSHTTLEPTSDWPCPSDRLTDTSSGSDIPYCSSDKKPTTIGDADSAIADKAHSSSTITEASSSDQAIINNPRPPHSILLSPMPSTPLIHMSKIEIPVLIEIDPSPLASAPEAKAAAEPAAANSITSSPPLSIICLSPSKADRCLTVAPNTWTNHPACKSLEPSASLDPELPVTTSTSSTSNHDLSSLRPSRSHSLDRLPLSGCTEPPKNYPSKIFLPNLVSVDSSDNNNWIPSSSLLAAAHLTNCTTVAELQNPSLTASIVDGPASTTSASSSFHELQFTAISATDGGIDPTSLHSSNSINNYIELSSADGTKKKKKKKKKKTTNSGSNYSLPSTPFELPTAAVGSMSVMDEEELAALEKKNDPRYRPIEDSEFVGWDDCIDGPTSTSDNPILFYV